jgi:glycosyltransferase involved in cell wall biosynthesis
VSKLLIYLLTHNRPKKALEAIDSILAQSNQQFDLIVSDNSDMLQLRDLLDDRYDLVYLKRAQVLTGIEHGNLVLSEIANKGACDYFTLFHDDDVMLASYVSEFWKAQARFPGAAIFGANAFVERHGVGADLSFKSARPYVGPISPEDLLRRYFSHHQLGIAPLPSYIYKTSVLNGLHFDRAGGKYSDVKWLSQWCAKGPMIWIAEPIMVYRLHDSNDGNYESRHDRLRFLAYLKNSRNMFSPEILSDYRNFLYKKLLPILKEGGNKTPHNLLSKFIAAHRYQRLFRLSFYQALINKMSTKLRLNLIKKHDD